MLVRSSRDRSSRLLEFLRTEEASGVFLLGATVVALVWANSPLRDSYERLWSTVAAVEIGGLDIGMDLQDWVNEGLMTLFFLVVALEVKREVTTGELRDPKTAALPIIAAIGDVRACGRVPPTQRGERHCGWLGSRSRPTSRSHSAS